MKHLKKHLFLLIEFQLLKSEEIAKMALIFTSDSLAGCKCLMKKIFNTTELQGMNWSGRPSINGGHKHAAFIKNPKTFFIFCKHNNFLHKL